MIGTLQCLSIKAISLFPSKAAYERTWFAFMHGGTGHSGGANMLPYIINRCEREGQPYVLTANPGHGYYIKPGKK